MLANFFVKVRDIIFFIGEISDHIKFKRFRNC